VQNEGKDLENTYGISMHTLREQLAHSLYHNFTVCQGGDSL